MRSISLIAHNLRSAHNVGSLLRTAEGLGVKEVYLTGYTPYPKQTQDKRLPHLIARIDSRIAKTALGAEKLLGKQDEIFPLLESLKGEGYTIAAVEQSNRAIKLPEFKPPKKLCIIVGREVEGIEAEILDLCDEILEIPMFGHKESFNVVQASAMALYHCRFAN